MKYLALQTSGRAQAAQDHNKASAHTSVCAWAYDAARRSAKQNFVNHLGLLMLQHIGNASHNVDCSNAHRGSSARIIHPSVPVI